MGSRRVFVARSAMAAWLFALALVSGCKGWDCAGKGCVNHGPDDPVPAPTAEQRAFCERALARRTAWHARLAECCSSEELTAEPIARFFDWAAPTRVKDPVEVQVNECADEVRRIASKATMLREQAGACADALAAHDLEAPPDACPKAGFYLGGVLARAERKLRVREHLPECRAAFVGTGREGDQCSSTLECRAGLACRNRGQGDGDECLPPAQEGERCAAEHGECATGLLCLGEPFSRVCTSQLAKLDGACNESFECAPGLLCDALSSACIEPPAAGSRGPYGSACVAR